MSVFGTERGAESTLAGLESAHGVLQARSTVSSGPADPVLEFEYDPAVEQGIRITNSSTSLLRPNGDDDGTE